MRLLVVAAVSVASLAWPCEPAELKPYRVKGPGGLVLDVTRTGARLQDETGKTRWSVSDTPFEVLFAKDGSWVAFGPQLGEGSITIVPTAAGAKPSHPDIVGQLTADEQTFLTQTDCGRMWFQGWESAERGLRIHVAQAGQARPTEQLPPGIAFLVKPDGSITRETPRLEVDLVKLAARWQGAYTTEREETLRSVLHLVGTPTGAKQVAKLPPLVERVLGTADASKVELGVAGWLAGGLEKTELERLLPKVLASDDATNGALGKLGETGGAGLIAGRVFDDPKRPGPVRAHALQVWPGACESALGRALTDESPNVRVTAADSAGRCNPTNDALCEALLGSLRRELEHATVVPGNEFAHPSIVDSTVNAIGGCLGNAKDPGRGAAFMKAYDAGLRLPPENGYTPHVYLYPLAWAELKAPDRVPSLLEALEASAKVQRFEWGQRFGLRATQWRMMRALKAHNAGEAKKQYRLLATALEKGEYGVVARLDLDLFDSMWQYEQREEGLAQFLTRLAPHVGVEPPSLEAPPSRAKKPGRKSRR